MQIQVPTPILDDLKCRQNIALMAEKAHRYGLCFRPHFKTHQSRAIGRWFKRVGVQCITVSSVQMAQYFADEGWRDITIAFPVNPRQAAQYNLLAERVQLNILVTDVDALRQIIPFIRRQIGIFIKIDTGAHRTGVLPDDIATQAALLSMIEAAPMLNFRGFLTHAGSAYRARSAHQIKETHVQSIALMKKVADRWKAHYPHLIISVGDTPTCSVATDWQGVDEIRPGNFVTYDLMQVQIGACTFDRIALAVACPVVAKHSDRSEIVVYGGAIHLSKEHIELDGHSVLDEWTGLPKGTKIYGLPVRFDDQLRWQLPGQEGSYVRSLSQEHGVIVASPELFDAVQPGDLIGILPVHSCLTIDLSEQLYTPTGSVLETM